MSPQAGYILKDQIAPRLGAAIPRTVLPVGAEDPEELVYDGICMAAQRQVVLFETIWSNFHS